MTGTTAGPAETGFSLGNILRLTLWAIRRQWTLVVGIALAVAALSQWVEYQQYFYLWMGETPGLIVSTYVDMVLSYIATALIAIPVYRDLAPKLGLGMPEEQELATATAPIAWLSVLASLRILVGYILLVVPGVFLSIIWFVVMPALILENRTPRAAFSRSEKLTKGFRWPIFGFNLAVLLGLIVLLVPLMFLGIDNGDLLEQDLEDPGATYWVAMTIVIAAMNAILYAATIVIYALLVRIKDGSSAQSVAAVFD